MFIKGIYWYNIQYHKECENIFGWSCSAESNSKDDPYNTNKHAGDDQFVQHKSFSGGRLSKGHSEVNLLYIFQILRLNYKL